MAALDEQAPSSASHITRGTSDWLLHPPGQAVEDANSPTLSDRFCSVLLHNLHKDAKALLNRGWWWGRGSGVLK